VCGSPFTGVIITARTSATSILFYSIDETAFIFLEDARRTIVDISTGVDAKTSGRVGKMLCYENTPSFWEGSECILEK